MAEEADEVSHELLLTHLQDGSAATAVRGNGLQHTTHADTGRQQQQAQPESDSSTAEHRVYLWDDCSITKQHRRKKANPLGAVGVLR